MTRLHVRIAGLLLVGMVSHAHAAAQDDPPPSVPAYRLHIESQGSGPWVWRISGGAGIVEVHAEEQRYAADGSGDSVTELELRMLTGPALDGWPSTIDDEWGVLVPAIGDPPDVASGEPVFSGGSVMAYDSIRWELRRGDRDETKAGRQAEHWMLTVGVWGVASPGEEMETRVELSGRGDLWFDPTLPFSAVPFAAHNSGFPLGIMDPAASLHVLHEALPELRERGFLLRAELTETRLSHLEGLDQPMQQGPDESTVWVDEISPDADGGAGSDDYLARYARLDATRTADLEMGTRLMWTCGAVEDISAASSATGTLAGASIEGGSVFLAEEGQPFQLVIGQGPEGAELICLAVTGPVGIPGPGTFETNVPDLRTFITGAPAAGTAWAMAVSGPSDAPQPTSLFIPESGSLVIESASAERIEGRLDLDGWQIIRPPDGGAGSTEVRTDVSVTVTFVALPGG